MLREWLKKYGFLPQYTEVSLFLMSVSFLLVVASNFSLFDWWSKIVSDIFEEPVILIPLGVFFVGFFFSLYSVFTFRAHSHTEKRFMLAFAVCVNAGAGVLVGAHALGGSRTNPEVILALWNMLNGMLLAWLWRTNYIGEDTILDIQAKKHEIIIGVFAVVVIWLVAQYWFGLYWAVTFSLCVGYATTFNTIVGKMFLGTKVD